MTDKQPTMAVVNRYVRRLLAKQEAQYQSWLAANDNQPANERRAA